MIVTAQSSPGITRASTISLDSLGRQDFSLSRNLDVAGRKAGGRPILRTLLDGTTQFSGPLMPTVLIRTGPQVQSWDRHFVGGDGPSRDRFGIVTQTFWAGHRPLLSRKFGVEYHWVKRMGLARSLVCRRWADNPGTRWIRSPIVTG